MARPPQRIVAAPNPPVSASLRRTAEIDQTKDFAPPQRIIAATAAQSVEFRLIRMGCRALAARASGSAAGGSVWPFPAMLRRASGSFPIPTTLD